MINLRKLLVASAALAPLAFASAAHAMTVPSDYAQDVKDGNSQISSDPTAKTQQNEVKDGENVEGQVDDSDVQVDETVGDQEDNMDDSQQGEAKDSTDSADKEDSGTRVQSSGSTSTESSTDSNN